VVRELDDRAALEMSAGSRISWREDLNAVEEGLAVFRLVDHFNLSHDDVRGRGWQESPLRQQLDSIARKLSAADSDMIAKGKLSGGAGAAAAYDRIN